MMTPREIDALIAKHVMGLTVERKRFPFDYLEGDRGDPYDYIDTQTNWPIPDYTTSVSDAWRVVQQMQHDYWRLRLVGMPKGEWMARFWKYDTGEAEKAVADTAPMAICLAALEAKGVEV